MGELLNFEVTGKSNYKNTVVIAHGLFGSNKNWRRIAKNLVDLDFQVVVVDMRNHGLSFWHANHRYEDMADDLRNVILNFGDKADVIGHSMGGKAAMALALLYPNCVKKLVVVDIAPVKYTHSQLDLINAMLSINLELVETRNDLSLQLSHSIVDSNLISFLSQSVDFYHFSKKKWLLNLNSLKKNMSFIMDFPNFHFCNSGPTLVIRGARSDYVLDEYLPLIKCKFPNFNLTTIENTGHWLHAENVKEFMFKVTDFITD